MGRQVCQSLLFDPTHQHLPFCCPFVRSPPPPPPIILTGYQVLVDDDPEGFINVRRKLEDWFPLLQHVATSSIGASVGRYIADYDVSPEQLTRYAAVIFDPYTHGPIPMLSDSC